MNNQYNKIPPRKSTDVKTDEAADKTPEGSARPKLQSVVGAPAKKVKRSLFSRLIAGLVGPEGASGIGGYVSQEIIKPAIKNIIVDAVTSGINMIMYGERGIPNRGSGYNQAYRPRTNYSNTTYASRPNSGSNQPPPYAQPDQNRPLAVTHSVRYGVEEYVIADRYDAAHVLTAMTEQAERYGETTVADYYELIKVPSEYTDNNYGWRHEAIVSARIVPIPGGYIIRFPPVTHLK